MQRRALWTVAVLSAFAVSTVVPSLPSGWSYAGCMDEGNGRRGMNTTFYGRSDMTDNLCIEYCSQWSFTYAGIEMGTQCFCGNSYTLFTLASDDECDYACGGASGQPCGGYGYMTLFKHSTSTTTSGKSAAGTTTANAATTSTTTAANTPSTSAGTTGTDTTSGSSVTTSAGSSMLSSTDQSSASSPLSSGAPGSSMTSGSAFDSGASGSSYTPTSSSSTSTVPATLPTVASATDTGVNFAATPRTRDPAQEIVFGYVLASGADHLQAIQLLSFSWPIWLGFSLPILLAI